VTWSTTTTPAARGSRPASSGASRDGAGLTPRSRVLEVGAGSGQLTDALLAVGAHVVALEPSTPMASRLRDRCRGAINSGHLEVVEEQFEIVDSAGPFDHIWSADAWHWVDPTVGYPKAARLLRPSGRLVAMWTLAAVLDDLDIADRLNEVFREHSPDLERNPRQPIDEAILQAGREEITSSRQMMVADHWVERDVVDLTADAYAQWQLSYAHISALSPMARQSLRRAILQAIGGQRGRTVRVATHRYVVASTHAPERDRA